MYATRHAQILVHTFMIYLRRV